MKSEPVHHPLIGVHNETIYHVLNDVRGQSWFDKCNALEAALVAAGWTPPDDHPLALATPSPSLDDIAQCIKRQPWVVDQYGSTECVPHDAAMQMAADIAALFNPNAEATPSPEGWKLVPLGASMSLADCPIGLFISESGTLALKSEYGNNEGRIDAYIVSSGEFFWGAAPQTIDSQRAQMVTPVEVTPSPPTEPTGGEE